MENGSALVRKSELPRIRVILADDRPIAKQIVIDIFMLYGIEVADDTHAHDTEFPYLYWDYGKKVLSLTKEKPYKDTLTIDTVVEFISLFFAENRKFVKLNAERTAIVKTDVVKVGCEEFTFDAVEELYKAVQEMRKR